MNLNKKIIIFKNDAVGDLVQSLPAINNIINHNIQNEILIYLSERSKNFDFLFNFKNVKVKIVKYNLTIKEKIKIFYDLLFNSIYSIYILTPKNFYFYLPFFFRKIKFYAICLNSANNYKRPNIFLRKYLYKYSINDRGTHYKRKSTMELQNDLTKDLNFKSDYTLPNLPSYNNSLNLKNYIYFHLKLENFKKLGWGYDELKKLLNEFLNYSDNVILTKDIENDENLDSYKKDFNFIDFSNGEKKINNSKIYLYNNISGSDLLNVINDSYIVVAFHGMMTNLASINNNRVLDLFLCEINSKKDYMRYKNAFYEFKPNYKKYDFIVPSKNFDKTLRKMRYSLKK